MLREALTLEQLREMEPADAAALFIVRQSEGLTASEEGLLQQWLGLDEHNPQLLAQANRAWRSFDKAGPEDELLSEMRSMALRTAPGPKRWRELAAAAALILMVFGAGLIWILRPVEVPGPAAPAAIHYASAIGEVKDVRLADGSSMTLDAASRATSAFDGSRRLVELEGGRAYFAVMPDQARPFIVQAQGRDIVAVGTRFDVGISSGSLTVTLMEGSVTVGPSDGSAPSVTLRPGQQLVERAGKARIKRLELVPEGPAGWRSGLVSFDDQSLEEAAAIMNRYSSDPILIRDGRVRTLRISGQFKTGDNRRFAQALTEIHSLEAVDRPNGIELVPES